MMISDVHYDKVFEKQFLGLPENIQKKACKAEALFRKNPFHPSLRLHKLHGKLKDLWSISVDKRYRVIYKVMDEGVVLLVSVGLHAIYKEY